MKTIRKSAMLLLGASLMLASCSDDIFDKYPTDSMQMETYARNDAEVQNVLLDSYYYLRLVSQNVIYVNSLATDEAYDNKRNNSTSHISLNEGTWDATLSITRDIWQYCYNMINRCNTVLERLDNVSEENRRQFEGEAVFFRAYAYFNLVRLFGDVPLTTSVISDYSALYGYGREPADNIYRQIESDLLLAASDLPEYYASPAMTGRATRIAAWTMLADVQMTRGDFASAKATLENVLDYAEKNPSRLGLEDDVREVYDSMNPVGREIILAAQFNNGATIVANGLMTACIPNVVPATQTTFIYGDGTPSAINVSNGNSTLLMTWELWNRLRSNPGDRRLSGLVYDGIYDAQSTSMASDEVKVAEVDGATFACFPTSLKYYDYGNESLALCRSGCDNIIYRYAGVLLMYAECLNETGSVGLAASYLNMVRSRAGIGDTGAETVEDMRLAIEDENLLELHFEGHRWFNLVRTGRITPVMEAHFAHRTPGLSPVCQANDNGMVVESAGSATGLALTWKWSGKTAPVLFGIPYDQIQLTDWEQNELY